MYIFMDLQQETLLAIAMKSTWMFIRKWDCFSGETLVYYAAAVGLFQSIFLKSIHLKKSAGKCIMETTCSDTWR